LENILYLATDFGNMGLGMINDGETVGYFPGTAQWENPEFFEGITPILQTFGGVMLSDEDKPFFDDEQREHDSNQLNKLRERLRLLDEYDRIGLDTTSLSSEVWPSFPSISPMITSTPLSRAAERKELLEEQKGLRARVYSEWGEMPEDLFGGPESESTKYDTDSKADMKEKLAGRGLKIGGNMEELKARLLQNDQKLDEQRQEELHLKKLKRETAEKSCDHPSCAELTPVCPNERCHMERLSITEYDEDGRATKGRCNDCEETWSAPEIATDEMPGWNLADMPRKSEHGPNMPPDSEFYNPHGNYCCWECQPKYERELEDTRRRITGYTNIVGEILKGLSRYCVLKNLGRTKKEKLGRRVNCGVEINKS